MARPRKKPDERRTHIVHVRLNDGELAHVKRCAKDAGISVTAYLRAAITGSRPRPVRYTPPPVPRLGRRRRRAPWPRPKKMLHRHDLRLRLTDEEFAELRRRAEVSSRAQDTYARERVLGRRPRARPIRNFLQHKLIYELQSILTNFRQLADATDDERYDLWADHVKELLVGHVAMRSELALAMDGQIVHINLAGQVLNALARRANSGIEIDPAHRKDTLKGMRRALAPLSEAIENLPPLKRKHAASKSGQRKPRS